MEAVEAEVARLAQEVQAFAGHLDGIKRADAHLEAWNQGFGCMTLVLDLLGKQHASKAMPDAPPLPSPEPVEEAEAAAEELEAAAAAAKEKENAARNDESPKPRKRKKSLARRPGTARKKRSKADERWERVAYDLLRHMPKRYMVDKEQAKRLRTVWRTVDSNQDGALLSDIVKVCGCSVLQANECLGTLARFKLVQRKKERTGLRYQSCVE